MKLISLRNRIRSGWLTALATAAVVALASPTDAQTVPPPPASALSSADLAKVHLTAARNALSDVTQLPAAAQLTGETRTRVQQLITSFNELIGKSDWRAPYAKVEANLSTLLGSETPAPATATPGAVGTSGAARALTPLSARSSSSSARTWTCSRPWRARPRQQRLRHLLQPRHHHQRRHLRRRQRPRRCRRRLQRPQQHPRRHRRQHLRPRQTRDRTRRHRQTPASTMVRTFPVWRAICSFTWRPWR